MTLTVPTCAVLADMGATVEGMVAVEGTGAMEVAAMEVAMEVAATMVDVVSD
jgi:hypothetical protein